MAPILNVQEEDFDKARNLLSKKKIKSKIPGGLHNPNNFVYVPAIKFCVSKKGVYPPLKWAEARETVRMPRPNEFVEFLRFTRDHYPEIYSEIVGLRSPLRIEQLNAKMGKNLSSPVVSRGKLEIDGDYICYDYSIWSDSWLGGKFEPLHGDTLMEDRKIDFNEWLENPTPQGLPRKGIKSGDLNYFRPCNLFEKDAYSNLATFTADSEGLTLNLRSKGYGQPRHVVRKEDLYELPVDLPMKFTRDEYTR